MKLNKLTLGAIAVASLAFGPAANSITVSGVTWDPNSPFDFFSTTNLFENIATVPGEEITGYGKISTINGLDTFCSGCELTYVFSDYFLTSFNSGGEFTATGGLLTVYVDSTPDFLFTNKSTATDGDVWLSLAGSTAFFTSIGIYPAGTTLVGETTIPNSVTGSIAGTGEGYLDVTGGLAAVYLDTNTQPGGADLTYTSSFQPLKATIVNDGVTVATHGGTNEVFGESVDIPEPATLALLGLGLVGLGLSRRTKKA